MTIFDLLRSSIEEYERDIGTGKCILVTNAKISTLLQVLEVKITSTPYLTAKRFLKEEGI